MSGQMIPYFRCWLCWGVINPKGSVFNLDLYSLFLVNKELLSLVKDPVGSVKNILNFLKLPLDARRAACLPFIDFSMQKRKITISKSPFSSQTAEKVMGKYYNFRA